MIEKIGKVPGAQVTADGNFLIVSCHQSRSATENEAICLSTAGDIVHKASYVEERVEAKAKENRGQLRQAMERRRKKGNMRKANRELRSMR